MLGWPCSLCTMSPRWSGGMCVRDEAGELPIFTSRKSVDGAESATRYHMCQAMHIIRTFGVRMVLSSEAKEVRARALLGLKS